MCKNYENLKNLHVVSIQLHIWQLFIYVFLLIKWCITIPPVSNFMIARHIVGHYWFFNNENMTSLGKEILELFGHQF